MPPKTKARPGIKSVEIAADILQALAISGRPMALKDLAKAARMHPGKAHRYLVSLTRIDLVSQDEASGHYGIGPMAISLGLAGLRNVDVVRTSTALLPVLRDEINETVLLAIWSPQGPVVFALEESSRPVYMNIRVGSILPITTTATGHVFAAFLPRETTALLIAAEQAKAPRTQTLAQIKKIIDDARKHGLSQVEGGLVPGVNAIAAPMFDQKNRIVGVLGALGRSEELDVSRGGAVATALIRMAAEISRRIGQKSSAEI